MAIESSTTPHRQSSGICQFCQESVCDIEKSWDYHHESLSKLEASAADNCIFCARLLEAIKSYYHDKIPTKWPLYRWNSRRHAETRDTNEIVSFIFRPVGTDKGGSEDADAELGELTFHCYRAKDFDYVLDGPSLGPSTNSKQTWDQVKTWLENCTQNHPMCRRESDTDSPLPTRLLDISAVHPDGTSNGNLLVVNTKLQKVEGPYVTLSHSWGKNPNFITVQAENEKEMMETGFSFEHGSLTQNFREAIMVARHLHIRYIWIDSVCILQKNPGDFKREAPLMHQYYRHAFCNIAASDAYVPKDGLFRSREIPNRSYPATMAMYVPKSGSGSLGDQTWLIMAKDAWESQLLRNVLYTRAWVFQERMLARRVLHFSKRQVFFECATISACETLPKGLPRASGVRAATDRYWRQRLHSGTSLRERPVSGTADLSIEEFWRTAVNTYSRCELTDRSDKIIAFQGVAKLVKDTLKDEAYSCGLWSRRLEEQLAWRVDRCRQANGDPSIRIKPLKFPSWSWASMNGIIEVRDRLVAGRQYSVRDYEGGPIKFEVEDHDDTISVPKVLQEVPASLPVRTNISQPQAPDPQVKNGVRLDPTTLQAAALKTEEMKAIKICGYVRHGYLQKEHGVTCTLHTNSIGELRCDVFPDEPLQVEKLPCSFLVLAYNRTDDASTSRHNSYKSQERASSRNIDNNGSTESVQPGARDSPEESHSFSGIGIILQEVHSNHWYRIGTFEFRSFSSELLSALTFIEDQDPEQPEAVTNEQPRRIYLC